MHRAYKVTQTTGTARRRLELELDHFSHRVDVILQSLVENDIDQAVHEVMSLIESDLKNVLEAATIQKFEVDVVDAPGDVYDTWKETKDLDN